jgi:iron-sulfur cluster assembly accessory protein
MSVEVFDPAENRRTPVDVRLTARAITHIKRQLAQSPGKSLRLGIKESGCSGYMYELDYIDAPGADDIAVEIDETLSIFIRDAHLPLVRGTEVDYVTEGLNSMLKFKNPNADAECGCGESFSVRKEVSA